ncbi:ABC transporter substrate-binding protein, partial [Pseudomonas aeruginosa]
MRIDRLFNGLALGILLGTGMAQAAELPQRWVSAGGSLSEWVVALGGESKLVGVDTTSQHPQALKQLPSVGYQRQLAAEGVLALRPDILIGTEEMGPPPVLKQLEGAGVRVETLSAKPDLEALESNLKKLGDWLGVPQRAEAAELDYRQRLRRQADWIAAAQKSQPAPGVLLVIGNAGGQLL